MHLNFLSTSCVTSVFLRLVEVSGAFPVKGVVPFLSFSSIVGFIFVVKTEILIKFLSILAKQLHYLSEKTFDGCVKHICSVF